MALAHRVVAIYPSGATDPDGTSSQYGGNYSASYTTMASMEASESGDLSTGDGTVLHVEIIPSDGSWSGAPDTTVVVFDGWTTDKSGDGSFVEVKTYGTAQSSTGLYLTSAYILQHTGASTVVCTIDNDGAGQLDIEFNRVQFEKIGVSSNGDDTIYIPPGADHGEIDFNGCYFRMTDCASASDRAFYIRDNSSPAIKVKNCIIDAANEAVYVNGVNGTIDFYNCTIFGSPTDCLEDDNIASGILSVVNCAVFDNGDDFQDFANSTVNYCASDDNDTGTNGVDISPGSVEADEWNKAFTNYSATPPNVNVKDTDSVIYHAGQNQTADSAVPAVDIVGTTRPAGSSPVSIGAFEFVASGVTISCTIGELDIAGIDPDVFVGTTITATKGTLTIAGIDPDVEIGVDVEVSVGALEILGINPDVLAGETLFPNAGSLEIAGVNPIVIAGTAIESTAGVLEIAGINPEISAGTTIEPGVGVLEIAGIGPDIVIGATIEPNIGTLDIAGINPVVLAGTSIEVTTGTIEIAGINPVVDLGAIIEPNTGLMAIDGKNPTVLAGTTIDVPKGALVVAGLDPTISLATTVTCNKGSLEIAGIDPSIVSTVLIEPNTGVLTIIGIDPVIEIGELPPTPLKRTLAIASENRVFAISEDNRIYSIA